MELFYHEKSIHSSQIMSTKIDIKNKTINHLKTQMAFPMGTGFISTCYDSPAKGTALSGEHYYVSFLFNLSPRGKHTINQTAGHNYCNLAGHMDDCLL